MEPVHSATAHHIEPDPTKPARPTTADAVPDLAVRLLLEPGRIYTIRTVAILAVEPAAGQSIAFAATLHDETTEQRAPWTEHAEPSYRMLTAEHRFPGIVGTGRPLNITVALRSTHGPAAMADGVLSAIAIPTSPIAVLPSMGPVLTVAGPFPARSAP